MGRNSGSQITWSQLSQDSNTHHSIYYCQQHAKWDQIANATLATAFATLKTHIETQHGNAEQ